MQVWRGLLAADGQSLFRDGLLRLLLAYPFILGLTARIFVPVAAARLAAFDFDLSAYFVLLGSGVIALQVSLIAGVGVGFLILDEKDDRTLLALQVTPMPYAGYLLHRLGLPMFGCCLGSGLNAVLLSNFLPVPPLAGLAQVALLGCLTLPTYALFIASLAQNKVQGVAYSKALGPFLLLPLAAYFVPEPWQWLFGLAPSYWPAKTYWLLSAGEDYGYSVGAGWLCSLLWMWAWIAFFERRAVKSL